MEWYRVLQLLCFARLHYESWKLLFAEIKCFLSFTLSATCAPFFLEANGHPDNFLVAFREQFNIAADACIVSSKRSRYSCSYFYSSDSEELLDFSKKSHCL